MRVNCPVMQSLMGLAVLSTLVLAVRSRSRLRLLAGSASALVITSFLVTRFGNVPINQHIKLWAVGTTPVDYAATLHRWEMFHFLRTGCALAAFVLVIGVVLATTRAQSGSGADSAGPEATVERQSA